MARSLPCLLTLLFLPAFPLVAQISPSDDALYRLAKDPPAAFDSVLTAFVPGTYVSADGLPHDALIHYRPKRKALLQVRNASGEPSEYGPDFVRSFMTRHHRFVALPYGRKEELSFYQVVDDTGRVQAFWHYKLDNRTMASPLPTAPGLPASPIPLEVTQFQYPRPVESILFIRRRGEATLTSLGELPPRGYDNQFEKLLRSLFADRPDLLKFIRGHYITIHNLPDAIQAYNSGRKMRFR